MVAPKHNECSENSRSQIVFRIDIFRKLTLGAPENTLSTSARAIPFAAIMSVSSVFAYSQHYKILFIRH